MLTASGYLISVLLLIIIGVILIQRNHWKGAADQMTTHYTKQLKRQSHEIDYLRDELQKEQFIKE